MHLKQTLKDACAIDGMVSLRWFKNYMLGHVHRGTICKHLLTVLKEIQKFCLLFVNNTNKLDKH